MACGVCWFFLFIYLLNKNKHKTTAVRRERSLSMTKTKSMTTVERTNKSKRKKSKSLMINKIDIVSDLITIDHDNDVINNDGNCGDNDDDGVIDGYVSKTEEMLNVLLLKLEEQSNEIELLQSKLNDSKQSMKDLKCCVDCYCCCFVFTIFGAAFCLWLDLQHVAVSGAVVFYIYSKTRKRDQKNVRLSLLSLLTLLAI